MEKERKEKEEADKLASEGTLEADEDMAVTSSCVSHTSNKWTRFFISDAHDDRAPLRRDVLLVQVQRPREPLQEVNEEALQRLNQALGRTPALSGIFIYFIGNI